MRGWRVLSFFCLLLGLPGPAHAGELGDGWHLRGRLTEAGPALVGELVRPVDLALGGETPAAFYAGARLESEGSSFSRAGGRAPGWRPVPRSETSASAFALVAGLAFDVAPNRTVDLGYRYFTFLGARMDPVSLPWLWAARGRAEAHEIRIGLRYAFR